MSRKILMVATTTAGVLLPGFSHAQDFMGEIHSMHSVLDRLYNDMLPLANQLIDVARGIAGFGALWYIASRIWRSIANAEPVDFYPLLRPFAIGLAILLFPYVIAVMNGVLKPTVTGTAAMMKNSNNAIAYLLQKKEEAIKKTTTWQIYGEDGTHGDWYRYNFPEGEGESGTDLVTNGIKFLMAKTAYSIRNAMKQWVSEILQLFYEAAALCINTMRTFQLLVLAILGPLVLGISVFDGFQNTLTIWIARYINVFLWLPVANIFGSVIAKVQENMLRIDIEQINQYGDSFFSSADTAYIIFLIIGIVGYFTVPSVAGYIVHAGGSNVLLHKASNLFTGAMSGTASVISASTVAGAKALSKNTRPAEKEQDQSGDNNYMKDKISGK